MIKIITVKGAVQGVGYRPFIADKATKYGLNGYVKNLGAAVEILVSGEEKDIDSFLRCIGNECPSGAFVLSVSSSEINISESELKSVIKDSFEIIESSSMDFSSELPVFLPDIGICDKCMSEMKDPSDRRYRYPLISCASCGPRLSIINKFPYDRDTTTMNPFKMCPSCASEYKSGRRRHAQTISCHDCGPQMKLFLSDRNSSLSQEFQAENAVKKSIEVLKNGGVIALKGISGYQFVCKPCNEEAAKLRQIKGRENKPFAVMFPGIEEIKKYCTVNALEEELLRSSARPIVLLKANKASDYEVSRDSRYIGAFLASSGIHQLLLDETGPLIVSSANKSDDVIITDDKAIIKACKDKKFCIDGVLYHDRKINIPQDDSVLFVIGNNDENYRAHFIRRARGYAPLPVLLDSDKELSGSCILSFGGDLKNTFSLAQNERIIPSQYIGDLSDAGTYDNYVFLLDYYLKLFEKEADTYIADLHPGYFSTSFAQKKAQEDKKKLLYVQHHHAHALSVMAENSLKSCIGVSFDGTGYGTDSNVWGGEFLYCKDTEFTRMGHLSYVKLCGGDKAPKEPHLVKKAYLAALLSEKEQLPDDITLDPLIKSALDNNINTFISSSAGRLFDSIASLLGIGDHNSYEGECAIKLENAAWDYIEDNRNDHPLLNFDIAKENDVYLPLQTEIFKKLLCLKAEGKYDIKALSYAFHMAVCAMIRDVCVLIFKETGERNVCLSGGVFNNRIILSESTKLLKKEGFNVYSNEKVPLGDGGISLGQAYYGLIMKETER